MAGASGCCWRRRPARSPSRQRGASPSSDGEAARALLEPSGRRRSRCRSRASGCSRRRASGSRQRSRRPIADLCASARADALAATTPASARRCRRVAGQRRAGVAGRHHRPLRPRSGGDLSHGARHPQSARRRPGLRALTVEGALIAPAMLARIAEQKAGGQAEADYGIPKGLTLARRDRALFPHRPGAVYRAVAPAPPPPPRRRRASSRALLRDVFGFADISRVGTRTLGDRLFAVTLEALGGRVPVVVVPPADDLDRAERPSAERRPPALGRLGHAGLAQCERRRALGTCAATASSCASCATMPA